MAPLGQLLFVLPVFMAVVTRQVLGRTFEDRMNACLSSPCQNNAVCLSDFEHSSYTCICQPGYDGRDCENDNIDNCDPDPCLNGATCRNLPYALKIKAELKFECLCKTGYSGLRCDYEEPCPEDVEESVEKGSFRWPTTGPGQTATIACPYGALTTLEGMSKRPGEISTSQVTEFQDRQERTKFVKKTTTLLATAVRSCKRFPNGTIGWNWSDLSACRAQMLMAEANSVAGKNLTPIDVEKVVDDVVNLVDDALKDLKVARHFFNALSNVMEMDDKVLSASNNSCDRLLDAIQRFTSQVAMELDQPVILTTPNIAVETLLHSKPESYSFQPSFQGDPSGSSLISLTIPKQAMEGFRDGVRLQFVSYRSGKLFQSRTNRLPGQPAMVITATVGQVSLSGLSDPVTYTMPLINRSSFYSCVYWDELDKEWLTKGVNTTETESGMIECSSDHLTAFSILLDPTPMDRISGYHEFILRLISYVGSGFSILGLSITVLLYSLFKNLRRDRNGKILLNLSISLLMLNVIFLVGSIWGTAYKNVDLEQQAKTSERIWAAGTELPISQFVVDVCTALTISVHYLILSSLIWMLVEAFHMYQLLILVFANSETCFMLKRMVAAWGVPLIVVVTTAVLRLDYYQDPTGQTCGRMSHAHPTVYYSAFIGPICLILLINSIVFFMVLRVILLQGQRGRAVGKVATENGTDGGNRLMIVAQLRRAVTVMALLGVTWVAGAVSIGPVKVVMTYVFCVCNSLQGFVIFIIRVVCYPEARRSFVILWITGKTHFSYVATPHSSGPNPSSSSSRLPSKSNGKYNGSQSLLEQHDSGATNPSPQILGESSPLPENPNSVVGDEISLLHPALAAEPSAGNDKRSSKISKEGASSAYLRLEEEIGDKDQLPADGFHSANGPITRRRAFSTVVNLPDNGSIENPSFTDDRRVPPVRRTQSLWNDPSELSVTFRNGQQQSSLLRQDLLFHSSLSS